jgi:inner membrane protein
MKIEITDQGKWYRSLTLKLALLGFLGLFLLIPLQMIKEIILERQKNSEKVIREISDQWAAKQCFAGPVLNIPYKTIPIDKDEKTVTKIWHILPENLEIAAILKPEIRHRGIYKAVVYDSELEIKGEVVIPGDDAIKNGVIEWNEGYFTAGISDNRGLKGKLVLKTDGSDLEAEPGLRDNDIFQSGVSFLNPAISPGKKIKFSMVLQLSGSEGLLLAPLGKTTKATIQSDWSSPSFTGSFLPVKRDVDDKRFLAHWEITHLNWNFPQNWTGNGYQPLLSSFGVDLYQPVDHYQKSWRSSRYGLLFIALTFLVLIFLEITRKETLHIFHYFLVSLALLLFFSLLTALSEKTGFNIAYLLASLSTILMITLFTSILFREKKSALIVFGILGILYLFIFVLLTLEDYAFLAGNIGLFFLLSVIMIIAGRMKPFLSENNHRIP